MSNHSRLLPADWTPASETDEPAPPLPPRILAHGHQTAPHFEIYRGIRAILDNLEALAKRMDTKIAELGRTPQ